MAARRRNSVARPLWYDISRADRLIFRLALLGMLVLSVLFAMEWQSVSKAALMGWTWTGLVIHWWLRAILAGQWHGWQERLSELFLTVLPLLVTFSVACWLLWDALRDIETWDWVLFKVMWQRGLYDKILLKFAKQAILAGYVVLALIAFIPPLLWRRATLEMDLPEVPVFAWRTVRGGGHQFARTVTSRLWVVDGEWLETACYFDDRAGTVVEQWARWFAAMPMVLMLVWHGGAPPIVQLAVAAIAFFFIWRWQLRSADRTWPWPRLNIGRLAQLDALTLEPLANYYGGQPPEAPAMRGFTLVAHFANGRQTRISTTDHSASDLQEVHTWLTRELIDNRAKYWVPFDAEKGMPPKAETKIEI